MAAHFGSWRAGLQAAGLQARYELWTRERILEAMRAWKQQHGRLPTADEWKTAAQSRPGQSTVIRHFGSWSAGIAAAAPASGR